MASTVAQLHPVRRSKHNLECRHRQRASQEHYETVFPLSYLQISGVSHEIVVGLYEQ